MIKFSPPLKLFTLFLYTATTLSVVLLASCSSPTKYTPREPLTGGNSHQVSKPSIKSPVNEVSDVAVPESVTNVCGASYRVKSGDSLSEIAHTCNVSMHQLARFNKLSPPYVVYKNQRLKIPHKEVQSYNVAEIVPESTVQVKQKRAVAQVKKTPSKTGVAQLKKPSEWQWPAHKDLPYRFIRDDAGLSVVEIYGVAGQEIRAVASGSVVYSGEGIVNFGKMLVIKHDNEYMSIYAHNSALLVQEGDRVNAGQHIADLGATGNAYQPKLYLEARFQGRKIDIKKVLTVPGPL